MDLGNVRTERLLPAWMRDQPDDLALARTVDETAAAVYAAAQLLTIWDKIDELPEGVLDRLARELDIDWYLGDESIETKRQLIKDSDFVHMHKGTAGAVERVIKACFGGGQIVEWTEYDGEPHHFKAWTEDPAAVAQNLERFKWQLDSVKRYSSKLDAIVIAMEGTTNIHFGAALTDSERVVSIIDMPPGMAGTGTAPMGIAMVVRDHICIGKEA